MGWGMEFKAYLPRVHKADVDDRIAEGEDLEKWLREQITRACSPCPLMCDSMSDLLDDLCETAGRLSLLYQAQNAEEVEED